MTIKDLQSIVSAMGGGKTNPQIEVFTDVGQPADLISIEYCKVNNIITLLYETKEDIK